MSITNTTNLKILKLNLVSSSGVVVDLLANFTGVEIFESIHDTFITGMLAYSDTRNLLESLPIRGDETLEIQYAGLPQNYAGISVTPKTQTYDVYKVENIRNLGSHNYSYILRFISTSYVKDRTKRIRKSYTQRLCALTQELTKRFYDKPLVWVQQCQFDEHIVFPNWHPSECMKFISDLAVGIDGCADYVYFENFNGFNFVSTNWLISQPIVASYNQALVTSYTAKAPKYKIENSYGISLFDNVGSMESGMFGSKTLVHDLVKKEHKEITDTYESTYDSFNHQGSQPLTKIHGKAGYENNRYSFVPINSTTYGNVAAWVNKDVIRKPQFLSNEHTLEITGDDRVLAGCMIQVDSPQRGLKDSNIKSQRQSGKYLVTRVRKLITPEKYQMILSIVKESLDV